MMEGLISAAKAQFWCETFVMGLRVDHTDVAKAADLADHAVKAFARRIERGDFNGD